MLWLEGKSIVDMYTPMRKAYEAIPIASTGQFDTLYALHACFHIRVMPTLPWARKTRELRYFDTS